LFNGFTCGFFRACAETCFRQAIPLCIRTKCDLVIIFEKYSRCSGGLAGGLLFERAAFRTLFGARDGVGSGQTGCAPVTAAACVVREQLCGDPINAARTASASIVAVA